MLKEIKRIDGRILIAIIIFFTLIKKDFLSDFFKGLYERITKRISLQTIGILIIGYFIIKQLSTKNTNKLIDLVNFKIKTENIFLYLAVFAVILHLFRNVEGVDQDEPETPDESSGDSSSGDSSSGDSSSGDSSSGSSSQEECNTQPSPVNAPTSAEEAGETEEDFYKRIHVDFLGEIEWGSESCYEEKGRCFAVALGKHACVPDDNDNYHIFNNRHINRFFNYLQREGVNRYNELKEQSTTDNCSIPGEGVPNDRDMYAVLGNDIQFMNQMITAIFRNDNDDNTKSGSPTDIPQCEKLYNYETSIFEEIGLLFGFFQVGEEDEEDEEEEEEEE